MDSVFELLGLLREPASLACGSTNPASPPCDAARWSNCGLYGWLDGDLQHTCDLRRTTGSRRSLERDNGR